MVRIPSEDDVPLVVYVMEFWCPVEREVSGIVSQR
jgi:hypothetical protein